MYNSEKASENLTLYETQLDITPLPAETNQVFLDLVILNNILI